MLVYRSVYFWLWWEIMRRSWGNLKTKSVFNHLRMTRKYKKEFCCTTGWINSSESKQPPFFTVQVLRCYVHILSGHFKENRQVPTDWLPWNSSISTRIGGTFGSKTTIPSGFGTYLHLNRHISSISAMIRVPKPTFQKVSVPIWIWSSSVHPWKPTWHWKILYFQ